jgi:alpha-mannosidase
LVTNPIRSRVTVYPGIPRIDIHTEVINNARDHRLQVHFPAPFHTDFGDYDGHYQVVHRPVALPTFDDSWIELPRVEHPEREFIDISSEEIGLMLANRGLPEAAVFDSEDGNSEIALTLLRCVGWLSRGDLQTRKGDAGPALETPGAQMLGAWQFDYSIIPHDHSWQIAWQQAEAFNRPLRAVSSALHPGSLPSVHSFVNVSPTVIRVTALKAAEDGNGFILRGFNYSTQPVEASLKLSIPFQQVSRVRMDESLIEPTSISPTGELLFHLNGNEIFTFRFA